MAYHFSILIYVLIIENWKLKAFDNCYGTLLQITSAVNLLTRQNHITVIDVQSVCDKRIFFFFRILLHQNIFFIFQPSYKNITFEYWKDGEHS